MNYKYIILDFGNVIVTSTMGNWDITPTFLKLIDMNKIDIAKLKEVRNNYKDILSEKVVTLDEEYDMFFRFYNNILSNINYPNYSEKIAKEIAYDRVYNNDRYTLCYCILKTSIKNKKLYIFTQQRTPFLWGF